jgi:HSP20 family protein
MTLVKWNPRRSYLSRWNEWDNFLNDFFGDHWENTVNNHNWSPAVDIKEDDDKFTLLADLPGLSKKDIKINVKENMLHITGERSVEKKDDRDDYYRIERRRGRFNRSFRLPDSVIENEIKAKFKDGVLSVSLPKSEEVKEPELEITVN